MISFREIADRCDAFDGEVQTITDARKEFWAEIREHLPARDVKALKAAIKARRKRKADLDGEEAFDARVFEILAEIEHGTNVALAHARRANPFSAPFIAGVTETFNPETGEIIEDATAPVSGDAREQPEAALSRTCAAVASPIISRDPQGCASEAAERSSLNAASHIIEPDAQHEPTLKTTSPMPEAISPASSQEPCTHGSGEVHDRCESTSPPDFPELPAFLDRRRVA